MTWGLPRPNKIRSFVHVRKENLYGDTFISQVTKPIFQALQSRGARGFVSPHPAKFFVNVPFFSKSPCSALFERSYQKRTWKLIFYKSKLKLKTTLLIRFCQVENIKSITLFNSIANALGWMDIPLTDHKVGCYDKQGLMFHHPLFNPFCIKIKLCIIFTKGAAPDCLTQKRSRLGPDGASNMVGAKTGVVACINKIESIWHIVTVTLFS